MRISLCCIVIILLGFACPSLPVEIGELLEVDEELEDDDLYEQIQYTIEHPVNINTCSRSQLASLPLFTMQMADDVIRYRKLQGGFTHLEQLSDIPTLHPFLDIIKQYFIIKSRTEIRIGLRSRMILPLQKSKAFSENKYRGDRYKYYNRIQMTAGDLQMGLLTEKDPGESSVADHIGGNLQYNINKANTRLIIGDFILHSGQGLVFGGPYGIRKGFDPILPVTGRGNKVRAFTSVNENFAFRGLAADMVFPHFRVTGFKSRRRIDARLENGLITNLYQTGYHRFGNEYDSRHALGIDAHGGSVQYMLDYLQLGVNYLSVCYDNAFAGPAMCRQQSLGSVNSSAQIGRLGLFGEYAGTNQQGRAAAAGILVSMGKLDYTLHWRHFDGTFRSPSAGAFVSSTSPGVEKGIYWGWKWRPYRKWLVTSYMDRYARPVFDRSVRGSINATDTMIGMEFSATDDLVLQIRVKRKKQEKLINSLDQWGNEEKQLHVLSGNTVRVQSKYRMDHHLEMTTRFEYHAMNWDMPDLGASLQDSTSVLLFHDLNVKPAHWFSIRTRWAWFDAPLYDLRFYAYEHDLPGMLRSTMLQHRGTRWYILCSILNSPLKLTVKYEYTRYDNRDEIGSGDNLITGDHNSRVAVQMDWRY